MQLLHNAVVTYISPPSLRGCRCLRSPRCTAVFAFCYLRLASGKERVKDRGTVRTQGTPACSVPPIFLKSHQGHRHRPTRGVTTVFLGSLSWGAFETTHRTSEDMVGTRSRAPVPSVADKNADDAEAEEPAAAGAAEAGTSTSGATQPQPRRTRFSLRTPSTTDSTSTDGRDGGGSSNSPAAGISFRSRQSRRSSGQRSPSARTSLERLPQPPGSSPETPPRRSGRSTAGASRSQTLAEKQESTAGEDQGRSSGTRTSAELNALLGLDAAVRTRSVCLNLVRKKLHAQTPRV